MESLRNRRKKVKPTNRSNKTIPKFTANLKIELQGDLRNPKRMPAPIYKFFLNHKCEKKTHWYTKIENGAKTC